MIETSPATQQSDQPDQQSDQLPDQSSEKLTPPDRLNRSIREYPRQLFIARGGLFLLLLILSLASCYYCYQSGISNIYGDGLAHLDIARRIVDLDSDSLWQHYAQLGSPWLPLPHLLMLPFIGYDLMWRTGLAGSIVSMSCYLIASMLIFEIGLIFGGLVKGCRRDLTAGLLAALTFALNPSLLYMQTTPMTELPFLAVFIASIWLLLKWSIDQRTGLLIWAGLVAALATITRYEAWALLPAGGLVIGLSVFSSTRSRQGLIAALRAMLIWLAAAGCGPIYWLWHNWATYHNPLEFYNGFYSAKGIYLRAQERLGWADFVIGNPALAILLALVTAASCIGLLLVLLWLVSLVKLGKISRDCWRARGRELAPLMTIMLLVLPFLFIIYSLCSGNIQIYPFSAISLLNVRYGLTILPALAIFPLALLAGGRARLRFAALLMLALCQYGWILADGLEQLPIVQEPLRNHCHTRAARARKKLAAYLKDHHPAAKTMMIHSDLALVAAPGGLNFRDIIFVDPNNPVIAADVESVIMKDSEPLWQQLKNNRAFLENFQQVYAVGPAPELMVWRRRNLATESREISE